jgi:hypothetical protein
MWTPNQLINDETLKTLREAGFSDLKLEFLGWLSYTASALNGSRNPVKAAHTLLAKAQEPDENLCKMFALFTNKKKESVRPKERADHDAIDQEFNKLEKWVQQVEEDSQPYEEPLT